MTIASPPAAAPARPAPASRVAGPGDIVAVMAGGVAGAAAREVVEQALAVGPHGFPIATLVVNIAGAFALGALLSALARHGRETAVGRRIRLVGGTGFCGAFTTYSTLAVECVQLGRHGRLPVAAAYLAASVVGGLLAAAAGIAACGTRRGAAGAGLPVDPDPGAGA